MPNINYNEDILIYPVTDSLSDITNASVLSHKSFTIKWNDGTVEPWGKKRVAVVAALSFVAALKFPQ